MLHEHTTLEEKQVWHSPRGWAPFTYFPGRLWCDDERIAREVKRFIEEGPDGDGARGLLPDRREQSAPSIGEDEPSHEAFQAEIEVREDGYAVAHFDHGHPLDNQVLRVLDAISSDPDRRWFGHVWPEYVASLFEHTNYYPAAPPEPLKAVSFPAYDDSAAVTITIIDMGFGRIWSNHPPAEWADDVGQEPGGIIEAYAPASVHGDLVGLVAANYAKENGKLKGVSLLDFLTLSDESRSRLMGSAQMPLFSVRRIVEALESVVHSTSKGIVVLTSGAYIHPSAPPADLIKVIRTIAGTAYVVAAAGNDGSASAPVYPAIDPVVLGVKAIEPGLLGIDTVACYSNRHPQHVGGPGIHETPFLDRVLFIGEQPPGPCSPIFADAVTRFDGGTGIVRQFEGGAVIRGTSFAAPAVAGLLARLGGYVGGTTAHKRFEEALATYPSEKRFSS